MRRTERYRELYVYEKDCNAKMLAMICSVPEANRGDDRFQQAVNLAGHLAACRENWLDRMEAEGVRQVGWFDDRCDVATLAQRFDAIEARWTQYLEALSEDDLDRDFDFPIGGGRRYTWRIEGQIIQLIGHAHYHRGQVSLLVDQRGGETVDTDYLFWANPQLKAF